MVLPGSVSMKKKKITKGRTKIEIKKIEETNSRRVTFSKRRTRLFKKVSELCIVTGAQIAILVNSPGGRVFTFGHPNFNVLLDRYLNNNNTTTVNNCSPPALPTKEFNEHYVEVSRELEAEKKWREMIPTSSSSRLPWFEEGTEGLAVEELEQYLWSLVELEMKVLTRADELMMINKSPALLLGDPTVWGTGGQTVGVLTNAAVDGGFVFEEMAKCCGMMKSF
ncbi:putative transcription factor MADS-type1 family [Helianthus annuus]|nr:putative transcription factor MADS-type1 family [Helianthus annuus]